MDKMQNFLTLNQALYRITVSVKELTAAAVIKVLFETSEEIQES
jgi:hypothetical protein